MSLRFVTGRAGSGKTTLCLNEINTLQENGAQGSLIYIVPEQFSLQAERELIAHGKNGIIMQAQVLSFNRLAYSVFSQTGLSKKEGLTDMGKSLMVKKTILENADRLLYFKKAANKASFAQQVEMTLTEFFKYGITDETLLSKLDGLKEDSVLAMKLKDMALIYSQYTTNIENAFFSPDETLDVLYGKIENSQLIKDAHIWIDGFYGFTPQETKIIEKLLLFAHEVTVTLTINEASLKNDNLPMTSVFYEPKETYNSLLEMARGINAHVSTLMLNETKRFISPSLAALEKGFTLYNPTPFEEESDIEIHYADNIHKEAEYTACRILKLVQTKGLRFKDIAVLTGGIGDVDSLIRSTFDECSIPYFMDNKRDMTTHPLILLLFSLMDMVIYSMNSTSVFSFLKTGLVPFERSSVEKLENYVLQYGIKGRKWKLPKWQFGMKTTQDAEKIDEINRIRDSFFDIIKPFADRIEKNKKYTSAQISEALLSFTDENNILARLDAMAEIAQSQNANEDYFENKRCWNIICSIMDNMHTINGSAPITLAEYRALFESAASASRIGIIPTGTDNVTVGDIDRTRLHSIKALFILGANEGKLPSPAAENGVFSEAERDYMEESGTRLAHNSKRRTFEEQFVLYSAITQPSHMLFVSCSTGTYDGKTLSPSPLIGKIKKIFPNIKESYGPDEDSIFFSPSTAFHHLGENIGDASKSSAWKEAYDYFKADESWSRKTQMVENAAKPVTLTERLSEKTAAKIFAKDLYSSISRLERFASCPYYYFADFTLKAKERPLYALSSPDLGTIFHGVLKDFFETARENSVDLKTAGKEYIYEQTEKSLNKQLDALGKDIFETQSSMRYLVKRLKRISARSIYTLCCQSQGGFVPAAFELSFGSGMKLPPIVVETGNGKTLVLNGQIDRLDVYEKENDIYVKITDYKSGNKAFNLSDVYYGLQLQLLIYIDAVLEYGKMRGKNILPAGVFYFRIKDPIIAADTEISQEDIENLITKELKLSGLILNNEEVLEAMDPLYRKSGGSAVIPVTVNKNGSFSKNSSVAQAEMFKSLIDHSLKTAGEIGESIQKGYIKPYPYRQGQKTPCSYCPYFSLCGFDPSEHKYHYFKSLSREDVEKKIENKKDGE